uniref:RAP domain-containing protein n=2 Tax=Tetraselmis sp. GSL018 TaxID=582737 RepID=A0A061R6L6_9CHLO
MTAREIADVALALAAFRPGIFEQRDIALLRPPFASHGPQVSHRLLVDLFQVELLFQTTEAQPLLMSTQQYCTAQRGWLARRRAVDPRLLNSVCKALDSLGSDYEVEWRTDNGLVPVDVMLFLDCGRQVALRIDGAERFTSSQPRHMLGSARLLAQILEKHCPEVVSVPFFEWDALKSEEDRRQYIEQKISHPLHGS